MYVLAKRIYERSGCPLPRHRLATIRAEESGDRGWLVYKMALDPNHKRHMMKAWLLDDEGRDVFPELLDAQILAAEDGTLTIRGSERDEVSGQRTEMAWWCKVLRPGKRGYEGDPVGPTPV